MLKKLLIILLISFISFSIFPNNIDLPIPRTEAEIITELIDELSTSTKYIEELLEEVGKLSIENKKLKESLKDTTNALLDTTVTLGKSTELIEELKVRIREDQIEVKNLRDRLKDYVTNSFNEKYFSIGIGIMYPIGGKLLFTVDIPKLPMGFFFNFGMNQQYMNLGAGVHFKF